MCATDSHGLLLQWINNIVTMDSITYSGYPRDRKTEFHSNRAALKLDKINT